MSESESQSPSQSSTSAAGGCDCPINLRAAVHSAAFGETYTYDLIRYSGCYYDLVVNFVSGGATWRLQVTVQFNAYGDGCWSVLVDFADSDNNGAGSYFTVGGQADCSGGPCPQLRLYETTLVGFAPDDFGPVTVTLSEAV